MYLKIIIIIYSVCTQLYAAMDVLILVAMVHHKLQQYCLCEAKTSHRVTFCTFLLEYWKFFALV